MMFGITLVMLTVMIFVVILADPHVDRGVAVITLIVVPVIIFVSDMIAA